MKSGLCESGRKTQNVTLIHTNLASQIPGLNITHLISSFFWMAFSLFLQPHTRHAFAPARTLAVWGWGQHIRVTTVICSINTAGRTFWLNQTYIHWSPRSRGPHWHRLTLWPGHLGLDPICSTPTFWKTCTCEYWRYNQLFAFMFYLICYITCQLPTWGSQLSRRISLNPSQGPSATNIALWKFLFPWKMFGRLE